MRVAAGSESERDTKRAMSSVATAMLRQQVPRAVTALRVPFDIGVERQRASMPRHATPLMLSQMQRGGHGDAASRG